MTRLACYVPHCRGFTRNPDIAEYLCRRHYRTADPALKRAFHEAHDAAKKLEDAGAFEDETVAAIGAAYRAWVPMRDDVLAKAMP